MKWSSDSRFANGERWSVVLRQCVVECETNAVRTVPRTRVAPGHQCDVSIGTWTRQGCLHARAAVSTRYDMYLTLTARWRFLDENKNHLIMYVTSMLTAFPALQVSNPHCIVYSVVQQRGRSSVPL